MVSSRRGANQAFGTRAEAFSWARLQLDAAGIDLGEVQVVVDDGHQRVARRDDDLCVLPLLVDVVVTQSGYAGTRVPVLVEDTGLELLGLGGFPGPLIKWFLASVGPEGICRVARAFGDGRAVARCLTCAFDGSEMVVGEGVVLGSIAAELRGSGGFGWDPAFLPDDGGGRTYGEMDDDEKNAISHRRKAFVALRNALRR